VSDVAGADLRGRCGDVEADEAVDDPVAGDHGDGDHEAGDVPDERGTDVRVRVAVAQTSPGVLDLLRGRPCGGGVDVKGLH
jgi:hypothetical protein